MDLLSAYIYSGTGGKDFVDCAGPRPLQFTFADGRSQTVTLQDNHDKQFFELKASGVDKVAMQGPDDERAGRCAGGHLRDRVFQKGDGSAPAPSN